MTPVTHSSHIQGSFILVTLEHMTEDNRWHWVTDLGWLSVIPCGVKGASLKLGCGTEQRVILITLPYPYPGRGGRGGTDYIPEAS